MKKREREMTDAKTIPMQWLVLPGQLPPVYLLNILNIYYGMEFFG